MGGMIRRLVTVFHCALGLALFGEASLTLLQSTVNSLWEFGFYDGEVSVHTTILFVWCSCTVMLTLGQVASALLYGAGVAQGGTAVLVFSILVMAVLPPTMQWAVTAVAVMILVETVLERLPEMKEPE